MKKYNIVQDEKIKLKNEVAILREIIFGFNDHLLKMQADCMKYLESNNTECGKDWFVSRMIHHLGRKYHDPRRT